MALLGSQNDFPFIYAGTEAVPDIGNEKRSTPDGVAKERSYAPSIVPDWEWKSCSFCIVLFASDTESLLPCLCLDCGGVAVCAVDLSAATREAVFGVVTVGFSDPPPSNGDLAVDGDGNPEYSRTPADLSSCPPVFERVVAILNVSVLEC